MDEIKKSEIEETLSSSAEPCLTLLMPTKQIAGEAVDKMKIRFKNLIREGEKKLKSKWNFSEEEAQKFIAPLEEHLNKRDFWLNQSSGLVMLKDRNTFNYYRLPIKFDSELIVEKYFHIKPYISEIFSEKRFFLLAVSRNSCRIFQGTLQEIEKLEIEDLPQGIEEMIADQDRESSTQQHSAAKGGTSVIHHGHDDRDQKVPTELLRYLKEIKNSINPYLKEKSIPLLVMCVKDIFPHLKDVFEDANMLKNFVQGSPDKLSSQELLERARPIIKPHFKQPYNETAKKYREAKGSDNTSASIEEIVPASYQGRIDTLMLTANRTKMGVYKPDQGEIEFDIPSPQGYDLVNYAAINTLKTGGEIYLFEEENFPEDSNICALFRY